MCIRDSPNPNPNPDPNPNPNPNQAALLVLHGPFVDEQHPTAGSAALSVTFDELFEQHVLRTLEDFVRGQLDAGGSVTQVLALSNPKPRTRTLRAVRLCWRAGGAGLRQLFRWRRPAGRRDDRCNS